MARSGAAVKLGIGLIGLGDRWQSFHRPALRTMAHRFDVRAVHATVAKLAESAAAEFEADPVDGYQRLVHREDIDAVMVLQSGWTRFLPAIAACEAGKAVYWGGDLRLRPEDEPFRQCVDQSGVAFMAELPRRYAPATLRLKELIATHLGQPRRIFCHERIASPPGNIRGRLEAKPPRAAVSAEAMDQHLIESIDWCRYVVGGSPSSVTAGEIGEVDDSFADYRSLSMRFAGSDASAQISCGSYLRSDWPEAVGFRPPAAMQVVCQNGVAFVDLPGTLVWFDTAGRHQESLDYEMPVADRMLEQFHRAVTSLVRNVSGLADAVQASAALQAMYRSAAEGRRVKVG